MKVKAILILWLMLLIFFMSASGLQTAQDWLDKGIDLAQQGKYNEAIICFDKAIKLNPQFVDAWNNKGITLKLLGRTTEGEAAFTKSQQSASTTFAALRIGYQPSTHHIAEIAASEKGWWANDLKPFGVVEINEFEFPSGSTEMQAMLAGDLDIAYVGTTQSILAIDRGMDAKIVAAVNINGSDLIIKPGIAYTGPQSLVRKSIGTFPGGSIQDIVMNKWLQDNDVPISDIKIVPMAPGDAVTSISAGRIDGVFLPHPIPSIIELEGNGKPVMASGEMWPNHACCSLIVSGQMIKDHPEIVEQIVKTHINATEYVNAHPSEAAHIYSSRTAHDIKVVQTSMKNWDGKLISDPSIQIPSTMEFVAILLNESIIITNLTEEDLFDITFYERANK